MGKTQARMEGAAGVGQNYRSFLFDLHNDIIKQKLNEREYYYCDPVRIIPKMTGEVTPSKNEVNTKNIKSMSRRGRIMN